MLFHYVCSLFTFADHIVRVSSIVADVVGGHLSCQNSGHIGRVSFNRGNHRIFHKINVDFGNIMTAVLLRQVSMFQDVLQVKCLMCIFNKLLDALL